LPLVDAEDILSSKKRNKFLKIILFFSLLFYLSSQDSLYHKKDLNLFKESAINLNSVHRPLYRLDDHFSYFKYQLNGINLNDQFSGSFNENIIPYELIDTAYINTIVNLERSEILNTIPYTKVNIIDGDFAYTDVDISFRQRLSEKIALVLGFNNKESLGNFTSSLLKQPAVRISADYFLDDKNNKYSFTYFFRRINSQDYGYIENNVVVSQNIYWKIKDNIDLKLSRFYNKRELYLIYSTQSNFERFNTGDIDSKSTSIGLGISDKFNFLNYSAELRYKTLEHPFYLNRYADIAFNYNLSGKSEHIEFFADHKIYERYFGSNKRIEQSLNGAIKTKAFGANLEGKIKFEDLNAQYFLFQKDTDLSIPNISYLEDYGAKIVSNTDLRAKKSLRLNLFYEDSIINIGLSYHLIKDELYYDNQLSQFKNRVDQNALFAKFSVQTNFWYQSLFLEANYQIRRDDLYPKINQFFLFHQFKSSLFESLFFEITNKFTLFYKSNPLLYYRYVEFFDYERMIENNFFRYELDFKFTLKTADIILSFDNMSGSNQRYVRGYEGNAFGAKFGIKWVFYY
jgi:hypothetical protein